MVGNGREIPAQNGLAMIVSAIKIARDLSTAQMLIVIISRNIIKRIVFTLIRKETMEGGHVDHRCGMQYKRYLK